MLNENFAIVAALLIVVGDSTYLIQTIRGKNKPNKVTWLFWAAAPLLAFAAQVQQKVGLPSLMTLAAGLVALFIFAASFFNKKAEWKITRFDLTCGVISFMGLVLWQITKIGNIAIAFGIAADGFAALPTLVKSFKRPESETSVTYLLDSIASVLTLSTVRNWNFQSIAFPIYLFLVCFPLFLLTKFKLGAKIQKTFS